MSRHGLLRCARNDEEIRSYTTVIPAKAGIQYAAAYRFNHCVSGILGHPPSRVTTTEYDVRDLAAHCARGLHLLCPPRIERAQGRPGACCTRGPVCDLRKQNCTRAYRAAGHPAFPAQWLYGLLRALPGERLFCLRRRRDTSRQLSASTAAPEPHDFTVRFRRVRLSRPQRPPHLTARS